MMKWSFQSAGKLAAMFGGELYFQIKSLFFIFQLFRLNNPFFIFVRKYDGLEKVLKGS